MLVVEDEALVAMLVEDMLGDLGHEVVATAGRLEEAIQLAETLEIDLAILDLNLNGERTEILSPILAKRGVPHVFATGYGRAGLPGASFPVLQKPFQTGDLARAIANARACVSE